jgi:hypothetical protein
MEKYLMKSMKKNPKIPLNTWLDEIEEFIMEAHTHWERAQKSESVENELSELGAAIRDNIRATYRLFVLFKDNKHKFI